jgi:hypothetical protein
MQYDGTVWQTVGAAGFSSDNPLYLAFDVDQGIPFVAYQDRAAGNKATAMKYEGAWDVVGTAGFNPGHFAQGVSLFVDAGVPYVASNGGSMGGFANVMRFNGATWESVGDESISQRPVVNTSVFVYEGTPYLAFGEWLPDSNRGTSLTVMRYDASR